MQQIWFSSDSHFYHKNIIQFCDRPYSSVEEMNEALIQNWNKEVRPNDTVYHLGDFAFCKTTKATEVLKRLNGKKHFIRGNHDECIKNKALEQFEWVKDLHEIKVNDQRLVMCHFPLEFWHKSHKGSFHIFGHVHGMLDDSINTRRMDVGVDSNNYRPVSFDEVYEILIKRPVSRL